MLHTLMDQGDKRKNVIFETVPYGITDAKASGNIGQKAGKC